MSKRIIDDNGWINIHANPLTKVGVFDYLGAEIGGDEPDRIYKVYRPEDELRNPETIDSFKLLPFVDEHTWVGDGGMPTEKKGVQGIIGENIIYKKPYLYGNIKILSESLKTALAGGKVELSAGYKCRYDFESGEFEGQQYDAIQRDIRANHLALVERGRSGSDVAVLDAKLTITFDTSELLPMNLEEILAAVAALSDEEKASLLSKLSPTTEDETLEEETEDALTDTEEAVQASVLESVAEVLTAAAEQDAGAVAEAAADIVEEAPALEEATQAMDSMRKQIKKLQSQIQSMDEGAILKRIAERDELVTRVKPHTGTFDHAMMTHDAVAQYGVKKLGIKCAPGTEAIALDAWLQGQKPAVSQKAMDSKSTNSLKDKWGAK